MTTEPHWTETFDWENAEYFVVNLDNEKEGPFKGREAAVKAAGEMFERTGDMAAIREASHDCSVAMITPDGELWVCNLHDEEGNNLSYRADF